VLRLLTFGGLALVHDDGSPSPRVRAPRLALLAALAVAGERGMSRERLMSFFWPDADEARGRHSLRQALYVLRHELGRDVVSAHETTLSLDPSAITTDVAQFRSALSAEDRARAVALVRGPFLDGFYLPAAPAFEGWVEDERARLTVAVTGALLALATDATERGDRNATVEWWRQLTVADPLSGRFAAGYLASLGARGDRALALAFAREHEALVRRELDADPDPEVRRIEAKLRSGAAVGVVRPDSNAAVGSSVDAVAGSASRGATTSPLAHATPNDGVAPQSRRSSVRTWIAGAAMLLLVVAATALARQRGWLPMASDSAATAAGNAVIATTSSPMAYRLYEEGLRAYHQSNTKAAQRLMRAALEEDSTFVMAAYYEAILADRGNGTPDGRSVTEARRFARGLAVRAPERERLLITAHMMSEEQDPAAVTVAESLATRHVADVDALMVAARVRWSTGDWSGAAASLERAIAIDSAAGTSSGPDCRLCQAHAQLADVYLWWDSLPAVIRTARRLERVQPNAHHGVYLRSLASARMGDSTSSYAAFRQLLALNATDRAAKTDLDATLEEYDTLERDVQPLLASSLPADWNSGAWIYIIALRNQGRLREALQFHRTGTLPGLPLPTVARSPDGINEGILALEMGDAQRAAAVFERNGRADFTHWSAGAQARHRAWNGALQAMSLAAAGDTARVRVLTDTVARWGAGSLYGRDRRLHHYVRGLVLAAEGRHEAAVDAFRAAIHSTSLGFTRVNYELARSLMRLGQPMEAVAALQPALRGEIDASNLYVTRTDLHELLAHAFDAAALPDSAARHYQAVVKAWSRADPVFHARRDAARRWLATQENAGAK
jgi:DNA-binding SARP family transcriptional activator